MEREEKRREMSKRKGRGTRTREKAEWNQTLFSRLSPAKGTIMCAGMGIPPLHPHNQDQNPVETTARSGARQHPCTPCMPCMPCMPCIYQLHIRLHATAPVCSFATSSCPPSTLGPRPSFPLLLDKRSFRGTRFRTRWLALTQSLLPPYSFLFMRGRFIIDYCCSSKLSALAPGYVSRL